MAFEGLSEKLQNAFKKLTGKGKLSEKDVKEAMREVKLALLEADVNFHVVKNFINTVTERAVGQGVLESLTPGQQVIKIVNEEMTSLMGNVHAKPNFGSKKPAVFMLVGLQGVGKTTMAGKLAAHLKKQYGKTPLLAACDVYRPAAVDQLKIVGEKLGIPVFERGQEDPVKTARLAIAEAERNGLDLVIIDTAGRLHVDEQMMDELLRVKKTVDPVEILLTVDAMTGQDAVNVAKVFDELLDVSGIILTKLDGDSRGGAALSVKAVTGKPIKFAGIGEKLTDIEPFHPDRMASRILGMGDMLSLIEKAQSAFDQKQAAELEQKLRKERFTLDDFLSQFEQIRKMGPLEDVLGMLPGMGGGKLAGMQLDEKQLARTQAIIQSMTLRERETPEILNASRKRRIAKGSGSSIQDINRLLNQFESLRGLMRQLNSKGGMRNMMRKLPF